MTDVKKIVGLAVTTAISVGLSAAATQAQAAPPVKCYGIAKAGKNHCGGKCTPHSCHGQGKVDNDPNDWVYVKTKAECTQKGGALKPACELDQKK